MQVSLYRNYWMRFHMRLYVFSYSSHNADDSPRKCKVTCAWVYSPHNAGESPGTTEYDPICFRMYLPHNIDESPRKYGWFHMRLDAFTTQRRWASRNYWTRSHLWLGIYSPHHADESHSKCEVFFARVYSPNNEDESSQKMWVRSGAPGCIRHATQISF